MRGILAIATVALLGWLSANAAASSSQSESCNTPTASNISWSWVADDLGYSHDRDILVEMDIQTHGTTGTVYLDINNPGGSGTIGAAIYVSKEIDLEVSNGNRLLLTLGQTYHLSLTYWNGCLGPYARYGTLAAFTVVVGQSGHLQTGVGPASPDQFHYIGPDSESVCTNVSFPQANWFSSDYGPPNDVNVAFANKVVQNGGLFYVGYVHNGQVDVVDQKSAQGPNMYVGGSSIGPSNQAGGGKPYYRVNAYRLAHGTCSSTTTMKTTELHWCTDQKEEVCQHEVAELATGTQVKMECWEDSTPPSSGASPRWFYVKAGDKEGYVPADNIVMQSTTPNCSTVSALVATNWALTKLGQRQWDGNCLGFINQAYGNSLPPPNGGRITAASWWYAQPAGQRHYTGTPPRGALVFWSGRPGYPNGHAALSLGTGWAISTYERNLHGVHVFKLSDRDPKTYHYAGWWNFGR